jgi:hypothetical protein
MLKKWVELILFGKDLDQPSRVFVGLAQSLAEQFLLVVKDRG